MTKKILALAFCALISGSAHGVLPVESITVNGVKTRVVNGVAVPNNTTAGNVQNPLQHPK